MTMVKRRKSAAAGARSGATKKTASAGVGKNKPIPRKKAASEGGPAARKYNEAYNRAYDAGYDKGFNDGYAKGLEDGALDAQT
jgi:flagellar biosynthesis/type III secretory pathway protein FliH